VLELSHQTNAPLGFEVSLDESNLCSYEVPLDNTEAVELLIALSALLVDVVY
jgi:hypothetical protein